VDADGVAAARPAADGPAADGGPRRLRVMSYNVLASQYAADHAAELYSTVPGQAIEWPRRAALLAAEVAHWRPDVVCMQEVDHFADLEAALGAHGYSGAYAQRTGGRLDGLATFWLRGRLAAEAARCIEFAPLGLKDNVTQLVTLRWRDDEGDDDDADDARPAAPAMAGSSIGAASSSDSGSGSGSGRKRGRAEDTASSLPPARQTTPRHLRFPSNDEEEEQPVAAAGGRRRLVAVAVPPAAPPPAAVRLVIANIHVLFNPKRGDIKLAQVRTMLEAAHALAAPRAGAAPVVCCGDFNSAAGSPLHEFVLQGAFDLRRTERRRVSGQVEVAGRSGWQHLRRAFLTELGRVERSAEGAAAGAAACEAAALELATGARPRQGVQVEPLDFMREPRLLDQGGPARALMRPAASPAGSASSGGGPPGLDRAESASSASSSRSGGNGQMRPWAMDELRMAVGEAAAPAGPRPSPPLAAPSAERPAGGGALARHPLRLESAYAQVLGREPLYTTLHDKYVGTVDYIFYTPQAPLRAPHDEGGAPAARMRPLRVLQPPPLRTLTYGLPSPAWPSDHVSLLADFEVTLLRV
jgi:hypothetical protein